MSANKPKTGLVKRIKNRIIWTLVILLVVETVILSRLYTKYVTRSTYLEDEKGEMIEMPADLNEKLKRLRNAFRDTSSDAWALAQESESPEDAWFDMGYRPRADLRDGEKAYHVSIDVPGIKPAELAASLDGLTLTVTGVRSRSNKTGELVLRERFRGEFSRSFELPGKVSGEEIEALVVDGILRIKIPKGDADDLSVAIKIN